MISQQIYQIYVECNGRVCRTLGDSRLADSRVVNAAVKLCNIGVPAGVPANRPILLSYPDKSTGYLYMICCSPINGVSNPQSLFYHVLACSLESAERFGFNAFSMFDSNKFVTNYKPGNNLDVFPLFCDKQSFSSGNEYTVLGENGKPVVFKSGQPAQLVRSLLNSETVNRLKWAEFSYKELPDFNVYVMSNPDLNSKEYIVLDERGRKINNSSLNLSEKKSAMSALTQSAPRKNKPRSYTKSKRERKKVLFSVFAFAITLLLAMVILLSAVGVDNRINSLESTITDLNQEIATLKNKADNPPPPPGLSEDNFVTKAAFENERTVRWNENSALKEDVINSVSNLIDQKCSELIDEKCVSKESFAQYESIVNDLVNNNANAGNAYANNNTQGGAQPLAADNRADVNNDVSSVCEEESTGSEAAPTPKSYKSVTFWVCIVKGEQYFTKIPVTVDNVALTVSGKQGSWFNYKIDLINNCREFTIAGVPSHISFQDVNGDYQCIIKWFYKNQENVFVLNDKAKINGKKCYTTKINAFSLWIVIDKVE